MTAPSKNPRPRTATVSALVLLAAGFGVVTAGWAFQPDPPPPGAGAPAPADPEKKGLETAIFAGGCFWCMEPPFDKLEGVVSTVSGYTGGEVKNPTYEQVSGGTTGHTEALKVTFDPEKIDYATLLKVFWRNIDPLAKDAQFCDRGGQYRSAIFYDGEEQKAAAAASLKEVDAKFDRPVVTQVLPAEPFYDAEDYHQDYYLKNPIRYKYYRFSCGRDQRLKELWGEEAGAAGVIKKHAKPEAAKE